MKKKKTKKKSRTNKIRTQKRNKKIKNDNVVYIKNFLKKNDFNRIKTLNTDIKRVLIDIHNPVFMLGALYACNRTQKIPAIMPLTKYKISNIDYMKLLFY